MAKPDEAVLKKPQTDPQKDVVDICRVLLQLLDAAKIDAEVQKDLEVLCFRAIRRNRG